MAEAAGTVGKFVGLGFSVIGNLKAAEAKAQAAEFEAKQNEKSAIRADRNAIWARAIGIEAERRENISNRKTLGDIRAAYGASGVTMEGTPTEYIEQNAAIGRANELAIRLNSVIQSKQYKEQAGAYREQAVQLRIQRESIRENAKIQAWAGGIGGIFDIGKDFSTGSGSSALG